MVIIKLFLNIRLILLHYICMTFLFTLKEIDGSFIIVEKWSTSRSLANSIAKQRDSRRKTRAFRYTIQRPTCMGVAACMLYTLGCMNIVLSYDRILVIVSFNFLRIYSI